MFSVNCGEGRQAHKEKISECCTGQGIWAKGWSRDFCSRCSGEGAQRRGLEGGSGEL